MRKAMLGLFLVVPLAWAGAVFSAEAPPARQQGIGGTVKVQANSVMRLPKRAQELRLRRVEIGEDAALLIPLEVSVLRIEELHMAKNARIGVAPGEERISIEVVSGRLADGSIISAPGATGTFRQSAGNGRDLTLRLQAVEVESLLLDARGGVGAPGYDGLDGASGKASGCLWGSALKGGDGQSGSDGGPGGAGGRIRLEVPGDFPLERLQTRLQGGVGGAGGKAGKPGAAD
ncbi:TPA: collagen-like protein, partial [Pseudomonas aeruginosa]|nr:collagen-like protein [Pseudomonas aeruginosa]